ncbi:DeoR/GlpR family DNA-binding transcription regulator [Rhodobacter calidifons]|uniref:DeoR/GlpR transcriptional regulator n=1 Tax=Rhodobacter calidifons TaxID=2715277 RepID=A0ABX0G9Z3_9RHOB|nr:DeoR/GlpR family DNA-binding transcription regulator [Rhodobacter calidifons]NHB77729.1 DeoR/GlpR transcriptional regulator [Rhodobacter calidifons]
MKPHERQPQIEAIIRREGEVSVEMLAQRFDVSSETIRRDLGVLAESGRIQKVHGGARRPLLIREPSHDERATVATAAKAAIGRRLADAVGPGETLFIDTGSTTLAAAEALAVIPGLTVITNSCRLAERLARAGSDAAIHLLGGRYGSDNAQTTGIAVIEQLQTFRADRAVLTVAALDPVEGAMDASLDEAQIARAMVRNARSVTILADSTKFGRHAAFAVCPVQDIDLVISDDSLDRAHREALRDRGVELWT